MKGYTMDKSKKFVITIARQFGTGGHEIGEEIAKRLGVKLIDKQILTAVAEKLRITPEKAARLDEKRPSWWDDFAVFYRAFADSTTYSGNARELTSRQMFNAQAAEIKAIARHESCVVIGRCGFYLFADTPNTVRIFLHADRQARLKRIMQIYNTDERKARQMMEEHDYGREIYTKDMTGKTWNDATNYDLCLDITPYSTQKATDLLMEYINK